MKKPVDVEILGQKLVLRSEEEEVYVRKVAGYVDIKMKEVLMGNQPVTKANVAMLAALNIADEYYRLKDRYEEVLTRLDRWSEKLSITLTKES
jgi:cell division protein ZapA